VEALPLGDRIVGGLLADGGEADGAWTMCALPRPYPGAAGRPSMRACF
jgi:hypothetical protein